MWPAAVKCARSWSSLVSKGKLPTKSRVPMWRFLSVLPPCGPSCMPESRPSGPFPTKPRAGLWHLPDALMHDSLPSDAAVSLRNATKRFGSFTALDSVSLDIRRGEVFALLGPNGAGKTTLISLVAGIARPTSGSVHVLGHDVESEYQLTRRSVGLVPQEINFDPFFTVQEALRFQAGYFGVRLADERLMEILSALGLADKRSANTRALSGGMKRRLLIAKALVHRPPVLFLDEPTARVDVGLGRDHHRPDHALPRGSRGARRPDRRHQERQPAARRQEGGAAHALR